MKKLGFLLIGFNLVAGSALADRTLSMRLHPNYDKVTIKITGFSTAEENTIEQALNFLYSRIRDMRKEMDLDASFVTSFQKCVAKYSTKDWINASSTKEANGYWTYTNFVMGLTKHIKNNRAIHITAFAEDNNVWGRAFIGSAPTSLQATQYTDISLNRTNVAKNPNRENDWAGTIYHEIQHRHGLVHPTGYEGSLIKEAGLCIARSFQDKPTGFGLVGTPMIID